jgi:hypothetical protein
MPEPPASTFDDPAGLEVLEGGSADERAQLIEQRLQKWKSAANAF